MSSAIDALKGGQDTWDHYLSEVPAAEIDLSNADLSDADLQGRNLTGINLSQADCFGCNLAQVNLKHAQLDGAELSEARLQGAGLYKANLDEALLSEADLSSADLSECILTGADLRGANLRGANLARANLQGANLSRADLREADLTGANVTSASFRLARMDGANVTRLVYGSLKGMTGHFLGVRGVDATYGNALFVRDAKDQDYIDTLDLKLRSMPESFAKKVELLLFAGWRMIDHGRSLMRVSLWAFIVATLYGLIYTADMTLGWGMMDYSNSAESWFTPFYYSMVTYTTLGYGDVTANNAMGEVLVISEVVIGYFTLGLILSILANTIARRS